MNNEKLFGAIPILVCVNLLRCLLLLFCYSFTALSLLFVCPYVLAGLLMEMKYEKVVLFISLINSVLRWYIGFVE